MKPKAMCLESGKNVFSILDASRSGTFLDKGWALLMIHGSGTGPKGRQMWHWNARQEASLTGTWEKPHYFKNHQWILELLCSPQLIPTEESVLRGNTVTTAKQKESILQKTGRTWLFSLAARRVRKDMNAVYRYIRRINNMKEKQLLALGQCWHESKWQ